LPARCLATAHRRLARGTIRHFRGQARAALSGARPRRARDG
jgi:hypothetical protein